MAKNVKALSAISGVMLFSEAKTLIVLRSVLRGHNDSQQIPAHSLLKLIKLKHNLATNCHAVQRNKH